MVGGVDETCSDEPTVGGGKEPQIDIDIDYIIIGKADYSGFSSQRLPTANNNHQYSNFSCQSLLYFLCWRKH